MAILKHVAGKSADYGAALDYLKYEHDEVLKKPLLDANGNWVLRRDILLDGINCEPELFDVECEMLNAQVAIPSVIPIFATINGKIGLINPE